MSRVKLFAHLRRAAGVRELEILAPDVRQAIQKLVAGNEVLREAILDDGELRAQVRVMVNGLDVELGQGLSTPLKPGDELAIFPPIGGG